MGRINYGRVLLGGLVAGVVINFGEFILNGLILMDEYQAMMDSYGLTEASWAMGGYILSSFILGVVAAWLYAAIRPRFGPGWKTGAIAGVALWAAVYPASLLWFGAMGLIGTVGMTVLGLVWGVVEYALAGVVGGWVYREGATPAAEPAAAEPGGSVG